MGVWTAAATLVACSSGAASRPPPDVGWIDAATPPPAAPTAGAPAAPTGPEARWDLGEQVKRLQPAVRRARSEHLGGELEGEVLASPASGYPLRGPARRTAIGTTLVERLFQPGGAQPVTHFVMVKRAPGYNPGGGDWEYLVVAPDGRVSARGQLALCGRCHAEAPQDHLFGGSR